MQTTQVPVQPRNDTGGWLLVHDQIRAVVTDVLEQVRALRPEDPVGARMLVPWWLSFSRSLVHHMHAEDDRIWPVLAEVAPARRTALETLTGEHRAIEALLADVDTGIAALPALLPTDRFPAARRALLDRLAALRTAVHDGIAHEEAVAFPIGREQVGPDAWARIEQDMVKGLTLRDVSTLMPRILEQADPAGRDRMLSRLPAPLRLLVVRVFEPRYRRTRAALPAGRAVG